MSKKAYSQYLQLADSGVGKEWLRVIESDLAGGVSKSEVEQNCVNALVSVYGLYLNSKERWSLVGPIALVEGSDEVMEKLAQACGSKRAVNWEDQSINVVSLGARASDMRLINGGVAGGCSVWEPDINTQAQGRMSLRPLSLSLFGKNQAVPVQILNLMLKDVIKGIATEEDLRAEVKTVCELGDLIGSGGFSKDLLGLMESQLERQSLVKSLRVSQTVEDGSRNKKIPSI